MAKSHKGKTAVRGRIWITAAALTAVSVAGIYAYFTDQNYLTNVLTTGKNTTEIEEKFEPPEAGKKTVKTVQVKNTDTVPCYVRARVTLSDTKMEDYLDYYNNGDPGMNQSDWERKSDGFYYYLDVLNPGEDTKPLFTHIQLKKDMPVEEAEFSVDIYEESVQSEGSQSAFEAFESIRAKEQQTSRIEVSLTNE